MFSIFAFGVFRPRRPKKAPKIGPKRPKRRPRRPKRAGPERALRGAQEGEREMRFPAFRPQGKPDSASRRPKGPQEARKRPKRSLKTASKRLPRGCRRDPNKHRHHHDHHHQQHQRHPHHPTHHLHHDPSNGRHRSCWAGTVARLAAAGWISWTQTSRSSAGRGCRSPSAPHSSRSRSSELRTRPAYWPSRFTSRRRDS